MSLAIASCFASDAVGEIITHQKWVVIDQVLSGDVPSISLLTEDDVYSSKTLIYETHGDCERDVFLRYSEHENFFVMNHPGFYHAAFTFDETYEGKKITRRLACISINM